MRLTAKEFARHIEELDLSVGWAARILGVDDEMIEAWASGAEEVPTAESIALILMVEFKVDPYRFGYTNPGD